MIYPYAKYQKSTLKIYKPDNNFFTKTKRLTLRSKVMVTNSDIWHMPINKCIKREKSYSLTVTNKMSLRSKVVNSGMGHIFFKWSYTNAKYQKPIFKGVKFTSWTMLFLKKKTRKGQSYDQKVTNSSTTHSFEHIYMHAWY